MQETSDGSRRSAARGSAGRSVGRPVGAVVDALALRYPPKVTTVPGADGGGEGPPTMPSTDGEAMMFTLEVSTTYGPPESIVGPLREAAKDRPAGLELAVTGPAAVDGDLDA
jgi:RND superfamily putative drug exporter